MTRTGPVETIKPANNFSVMVEIEVPRGEELSRHTLNTRLGILGGISILGIDRPGQTIL